jgi:hypothetical protein
LSLGGHAGQFLTSKDAKSEGLKVGTLGTLRENKRELEAANPVPQQAATLLQQMGFPTHSQTDCAEQASTSSIAHEISRGRVVKGREVAHPRIASSISGVTRADRSSARHGRRGSRSHQRPGRHSASALGRLNGDAALDAIPLLQHILWRGVAKELEPERATPRVKRQDIHFVPFRISGTLSRIGLTFALC